MTESGVAQILVAAATLITAFSSLLVSLKNQRKIQEVHDLSNGMKTELVTLTAKSSFAEGVKSETDKTKP